MSKLEIVFEVAGLHGHWETTAPLMHSSCNDGVISSDAVLEVVDISHASLAAWHVCPTHCNQLNLNPANLEATIEAEWILNSFSSCENGIFQRRHNYVIITLCRASVDGTFYNFSVAKKMSGWFIPKIVLKKLSKFVEVTAEIPSVPFSGLGVMLWLRGECTNHITVSLSRD